jgi:hypothetical protein
MLFIIVIGSPNVHVSFIFKFLGEQKKKRKKLRA